MASRTGPYDCVFETIPTPGIPLRRISSRILHRLKVPQVSESLTALLVRAGALEAFAALPLVNTIQTYSFRSLS